MPCTFKENCTLQKSNDDYEPTVTHKNGKHILIKKPTYNFQMEKKSLETGKKFHRVIIGPHSKVEIKWKNRSDIIQK